MELGAVYAYSSNSSSPFAGTLLNFRLSNKINGPRFECAERSRLYVGDEQSTNIVTIIQMPKKTFEMAKNCLEMTSKILFAPRKNFKHFLANKNHFFLNSQ